MTMKTLTPTPELINKILNRYKTPEYPCVPTTQIINEFNRLTIDKYIEPNKLNDEETEFVYNDTKSLFYCIFHSPLKEVELSYWQSHRFYHGINHLEELFSLIELFKEYFSKDFIVNLQLVALFHDAVYNPKSDTNELDSALLFKKCVEDVSNQKMHVHKNALIFEEIFQAILDTKTKEPKSELSKVFCALDMFVISHYSFEKLLAYEHQIFKEYQHIPYSLYKIGRIDVLQRFNDIYKRPEIEHLIEYIKFRIPRVGVYAGSFRPFHIGHHFILKKSESMFDKVIIARGVNPDKPNNNDFLTNLEEVFPYHQTIEFNGYLYDFMSYLRETGIEPYLIRGLRNEDDFKFELMQDFFNEHRYSQKRYKSSKNLPMNTVSVFCRSDLAHISSSAIRTMEKIEPGSAEKFIYKHE